MKMRLVAAVALTAHMVCPGEAVNTKKIVLDTMKVSSISFQVENVFSAKTILTFLPWYKTLMKLPDSNDECKKKLKNPQKSQPAILEDWRKRYAGVPKVLILTKTPVWLDTYGQCLAAIGCQDKECWYEAGDNCQGNIDWVEDIDIIPEQGDKCFEDRVQEYLFVLRQTHQFKKKPWWVEVSSSHQL